MASLVVESMIIDIEQNAKAVLEPTLNAIEPELISRETAICEIQANSARWLREGPIIDMRSLPWEALASSSLELTTVSSRNQHSQNILGDNIRDVRHNASSPSLIMASGAVGDEHVQNAIGDAIDSAIMNIVKSQRSSE